MRVIGSDVFVDFLIQDFFDDRNVCEPVVAMVNKMAEQTVNNIPIGNFYSNKNGDIKLEFAASGYNKEDLEITIVNSVLTIVGNKNKTKDDEWESYPGNKISYRNFVKKIVLPSIVDIEHYSASLENGVLTIIFKANPKNVQKLTIS